MSPLRTAAQILFGGLIDYAGVFPPASLELDAAVAEYRAARLGPHSWLLGRFIITASRLEALGGMLMASMQSGEEPWAISVILDGEVAAAAFAARAFDSEMEPAAQVALLEVALPTEASDGRDRQQAFDASAPVVTAALSASAVATPFFEIKLDAGWETGLGAAAGALADHRLASHRPLGAKLRCGGVVADAFPTPQQVVAFIVECTATDLPFKATAGLHHPIRHFDPDLGVMRHGFLNLLVASALARQGVDTAELTQVVEETAPEAFQLSVGAASWRDHTLRGSDLARLREHFAGYGSCSFDEPVQDLVGLGMLPRGAF